LLGRPISPNTLPNTFYLGYLTPPVSVVLGLIWRGFIPTTRRIADERP